MEVTDLESGAYEVAVLNRDHNAVKFVLRDTRILMSVDLPALPFALRTPEKRSLRDVRPCAEDRR